MQLMETLIWHSNHGSQGGALTELLDGLSSHSHWSWPKGAPHQAWSEAALIHIFCEELLGIRIDNASRRLHLCTRHWQKFSEFSFSLSTLHARINISKKAEECSIAIIESISHSPETEIHVSNFQPDKPDVQRLTITANTPVSFKITYS